ncbi:MAG: hypothetical protein KDB23_29790 [Planctomycetales bacterium]|nr:hypothetical protein [Planctomycetales bacterium]
MDLPVIEFEHVKQQLIASNARLKYEDPPVEEGARFPYFRRSAWIYCTISNRTDHRWESLQFLVEFQNAHGDQLNLDNLSASVTCQPHSNLDIRLNCELAIHPKDVAKTKVTVTDARRPYR